MYQQLDGDKRTPAAKRCCAITCATFSALTIADIVAFFIINNKVNDFCRDIMHRCCAELDATCSNSYPEVSNSTNYWSCDVDSISGLVQGPQKQDITDCAHVYERLSDYLLVAQMIMFTVLLLSLYCSACCSPCNETVAEAEERRKAQEREQEQESSSDDNASGFIGASQVGALCVGVGFLVPGLVLLIMGLGQGCPFKTPSPCEQVGDALTYTGFAFMAPLALAVMWVMKELCVTSCREINRGPGY